MATIAVRWKVPDLGPNTHHVGPPPPYDVVFEPEEGYVADVQPTADGYLVTIRATGEETRA